MSKNILVTGGAGFIGSHLVDALINEGHKVKILDNLEPQVHKAKPNYLNTDAEFIQGDIRNEADIKKALKDMHVLFHMAAMVGVGQSMYQIKKYMDVNTEGTAKLLDTIIKGKFDIEKIIVASSMSIYGEGSYKCKTHDIVSPKERDLSQLKEGKFEVRCPYGDLWLEPIPTGESKCLSPTSIYAISKKDQEELCLTLGKTYKIPCVALRFFNTYGPRQSLSNPYTGVCAIFLSRIKNNQPPIIFEDGLQLRDFVSVHDIVQASLLAMSSEEANQEVFNVGTGSPVTILDIAHILMKLCGKDLVPQTTNKYRAGDVRHCYPDISKIKSKLGYEPNITLEAGMTELIEWGQHTNAFDYIPEAFAELEKNKLVQ
jgi:dTDP-L-rhamnose 4-epimerase